MRALLRSPSGPEVLAAPGNAGIALDGVECLPEDDLVGTATERKVDLVVVGPEAPLVAGLVDRLEAAGVRAFGPRREAARVEGSKAYAKELNAFRQLFQSGFSSLGLEDFVILGVEPLCQRPANQGFIIDNENRGFCHV